MSELTMSGKKVTRLVQCLKCMLTWQPDTHLRKDGSPKTSCPHCNSHSTIETHTIATKITNREDLQMLTLGEYPQKYCPKTSLEEIKGVEVARFGQAKIVIGRGIEPANKGHKVSLALNGVLLMDTQYDERQSMRGAVAWCPKNANVFIGGLGLGLILLYLAKSGKAKKVIVCERSEDVIRLVEPRVRQWMKTHYSHFNFTVVKGDALEKVLEGGPYDWIFMDLWGSSGDYDEMLTAEKISKRNLTQNGRVTCWMLNKYRKEQSKGKKLTELLDEQNLIRLKPSPAEE